MESTLADIRQLYNVKAIAYNTKIENLQEGQLGVFPEGSDTSIASNTTFAALPERFVLAAKFNGTLLFSFDTIEKKRIRNAIYKTYKPELVNIWKTTLKGCGCDCMGSAWVTIHYDEAELIGQDGLSWTHRDNVFEITNEELACLCDCEGKDVYQNHLLTLAVFNKIKNNPSPYYEAEVSIPVAGITTGETLPTDGQAKGDLYIKTEANAGLHIYDGTAWKLIGNATGTLTDVDTFVEVNSEANLGDTPANYSVMLDLVIKGIKQTSQGYADLEVNHVAPRGVSLRPTVTINGRQPVPFIEIQALQYELGAGADLRAEEWENMNYYTDLNFYPRLTDGIASKKLKYQFENEKNYDTLVFEFTTPKTLRNTGEERLFGVLFGVDTTETATSTALKNMFTP